MIRLGLLLLVPVAPLLQYVVHAASICVFLTGILAVAVLTDWIWAVTEQLAGHTGPAVGGLLTISLGGSNMGEGGASGGMGNGGGVTAGGGVAVH